MRRERINSPVKILAQHVKRAEMGTNPAQKLLSDNMTAPQMFGGSIESDSRNDNEAMSMDGNINIRLDGEEIGRNELDYKSFDNF